MFTVRALAVILPTPVRVCDTAGAEAILMLALKPFAKSFKVGARDALTLFETSKMAVVMFMSCVKQFKIQLLVEISFQHSNEKPGWYMLTSSQDQ